MAAEQIDAYLAEVEEPKRTTLEALRASILAAVPDAEQGMAYGMPAFRVQGKTVAGYGTSKGSLKFAIDEPLPSGLVKQLVTTRLIELGLA